MHSLSVPMNRCKKSKFTLFLFSAGLQQRRNNTVSGDLSDLSGKTSIQINDLGGWSYTHYTTRRKKEVLESKLLATK